MVAIRDSFVTFLMAARALPIDTLDAFGRQPCVFPNPCWPSDDDWNSLNNTLGGSLVRARPPAFVCHVPDIDNAACDIAKARATKYALQKFWYQFTS